MSHIDYVVRAYPDALERGLAHLELRELRADIARLTRERDEAVAVAADAKEQLGLVGLVEWLHEFCWCASDAAESNHAADCSAAAWARRIGGLEETQRQVDAAHETALVEDRTRTEMRGAAERMGLRGHRATAAVVDEAVEASRMTHSAGNVDRWRCGRLRDGNTSYSHPTCPDCQASWRRFIQDGIDDSPKVELSQTSRGT